MPNPTVEISDLFRTLVDDTADKLVLKPLLERYLYHAEFPDLFTVTFRKAGLARKPDNYFHPSTHPLWSARQLYAYLATPDLLEEEKLDYNSRMAVTMGTAVHAFIEMCVRSAGLMAPLEGTCVACHRPHGTKRGQCDEYGAADEEVGSRGHMDGVLDIDLVGEFWKPGQGVFEFKCLAPETMVSMGDGSLKRADEVAQGDRVLGWDEQTDTLAVSTVRDVWDNGVVPIWTVRTQEGREVKVTDEHPFLTPDGWKFAKDLQPGDKVKAAFGTAWHQPESENLLSADGAYFLGAMVGDGGMTTNTVVFTKGDRGVLGAVRSYVESMGCTMTRVQPSSPSHRIVGARNGSGMRNPNTVLAMLRETGLWGKYSSEKFIPDVVMTGGVEAWVEFLSGYFDTDGTVISGKPYPNISWSSTSKRLLQQCQLLLGYLSIRSVLTRVDSTYSGKPYGSWRLVIRDAASVHLAMHTLHLRSTAKAPKLAALRPKMPNPNHHRTATPGWDKVVEVTEGSARATIAIEMENGTHVTDGLVTHNTMNARKAAKIKDLDLAEFKLRCPDYYAQVQEYMRMTGLQQAIVIIISLGYPWEITEIQIPYDPFDAMQTYQKYRAVREAVEAGVPPIDCCGVGSKTSAGCPARNLCHRLLVEASR